MIDNATNHRTPNDELMLCRYHRAESWEHEHFAKTMELNAKVTPHWIDDSDCFWYARINKTGTEYRLVDAKAATNTPAFDHSQLATALADAAGKPVSSTALPISDLEFPKNSTSITFKAFDQHWRLDSNSVLNKINPPPTLPAHWLISPDKKKAVFIREHNVWLHDLESGSERAITTDGIRHYSYATEPESRDLVAGLDASAEPLKKPEARWSPDSKQLLTVQLDERQVGTMPSTLYAPQDGSLRPKVVERKYALPGDKHIPKYRFLILNVETDKEITADYTLVEDSFIWYGVFSGNRAWWSGDSKKAYFLDMARGQQSVRVIEMLADSGKTRVLFTEEADTYLEVGHSFEAPTAIIPITTTNELIWFSQRSGYAHLYLYDLTTGNLKKTITSGEWSISNVLYFDIDRREVIVQLMGRVAERDFYYREIARVHVDNGEMTLMASSNHDYDLYNDHGGSGSLSPNANYFVTTYSRVDTPPVTELRDRNGDVILVLEKADISVLPVGWQWPEPVETVAADGKTPIYGAVFRPTDFDPKQQYPVLDFCQSSPFYAGVPKQAFAGYFPIASALAELGMIVVMLDGRGTSFRDKAFRDYGYDNFLENGGIADRVAGIKQLAQHDSSMDLNRVGIMHCDGSNCGVTGLLAFPDFYHVGAAMSIYDPRLVKQGEVYLGLTTEEKRNKAVIWGDAIDNLKGKLLLITGLRDGYFHPCATFQLTDALLKANKDFEHIVQPNGGHGWRVVNGRRRMWDFLTKHLLGENPPSGFNLATGIEKAIPWQMPELEATR